MKQLLLAICLLALIGTPALAGKNAGGAMVVHNGESETNYTFWDTPDYCEVFEEVAPATCEELSHECDFNDPNYLWGSVVWYVAAFDPDSSPGVTVVFFGHDHNFPAGFISGWRFCGPANSLEVPDAGWPNDPNAGNSIAFGSPIVGDHLFPFYWLGVYADDSNYIGTTINPTGGYAAFVSDDNPGVLDEITRFGQVRWFEPGFNDCPVPPEPDQACCFPDCSCLILPEEECYSMGGVWGFGDTCDPNPCSCPPVACCLSDGTCFETTEFDCNELGGEIWGSFCDPNPCPQPGACCFEDCSCLVLLEEECFAQGGGEWFESTPCDPNPCSCPPGACCFPDGSCLMLTEEECLAQGGDWFADYTCDPNPCEVIATVETTWGSIKSDYR